MDLVSLLVYVSVGFVLPLTVVLGTLLYIFPHYLLQWILRARRYACSMSSCYVGDGDILYCYGERNKPRPDKPSLIFVHGFTSSKDQWIHCFKGLPSDLHMIAVDLPGHGFSSAPAQNIVLDVPFVVKKIHKFLELLNLSGQPIHLIGSSLGGAIVGVYAAHYPQHVVKVTMVCPAMDTPVPSDFVRDMKELVKDGLENLQVEDCALLPQSVDQVRHMLGVVCYSSGLFNKVPDQIFKGFLTLRHPKTDFFLRVFKTIADQTYYDLLVEMAPKITMPSQLIWGRHDHVVHVSGADALKAQLPNCRHVDILERCGHAVDMDRPGAFNKTLLAFIREPIFY